MSEKEKPEIESRGVSVEAAILAGLQRLGLERDQVDVTVIDEGSRGLLGIGSRDAVVRLSPLTRTPTPAPPTPPPPAPPTSNTPQLPYKPEETKAVKSKPPQPPKVLPAAHFAEDADATEQATDNHLLSTDELAQERETAVAIISELLEKMHVPAGVSGILSEPDDLTHQQVNLIDIAGEDLAILIGPRGETLDSLQFLSRLMVSHRLQRRANFIVDVEGYRQRRVQALTRLAERMADKVRQRQEPISLEPMSSYERRIIHMTLRDVPDVYTESAGEGKQRKVRIYPK
jgi:spoIIIJ-associated protein